MTLGDGIFLSSIVLSLVALFAITKDRWNWSRIAKWGLLAPAGVALFLSGVAYLYGSWNDRPTPQHTFAEIALTATPADVLFVKGEPKRKDGPDRWTYDVGSGSAAPDSAKYLVMFKDGRIRFVLYTASSDQLVHPWLLGFTIGTSYERVVERLGQPSSTSVSEDQFDRMFSYEKYNSFFSFSRGKLVAYGIYQPKGGPMAFRNEAAASSPTK